MENQDFRPLADRMRPRTLSEFCGQAHLLGGDSTLRQAVEKGRLHSMVFWGPPGTGKTTLARMIAEVCDAHFMSLSAVLSGVKDIRESVDRAKKVRVAENKASVLFVDEVHRFNKAQQDAFLPHVEDGTIHFIGATTENPSFELNNALLSRVRTYVLKHLEPGELRDVIDSAIDDSDRGLGKSNLIIASEIRDALAVLADGDARRALLLLELAADSARESDDGTRIIDEAILREVSRDPSRQFDKGGEHFYNQISALHKSVRGSNPDAALYWYCNMIEAGCDPIYIARRVLRIASEDIGNADPRAAQLAQFAWDTYARLGSPEGELAIAQAIIFMASAPKSNAVYKAYNEAMSFVKEHGTQEVPMHIRNAPTGLMKELGYGDNYRYSHDELNAFSPGQTYFPDALGEQVFYRPVNQGLEIKISEKLQQLREASKK